MTVEGVRHAMDGREDIGAALGSGAVDAMFWALVCEDEGWLNTEFDAIISAAFPTPVRPSDRFTVGVAGPHRAAPHHHRQGSDRRWLAGDRQGLRWRRQRSPPRLRNMNQHGNCRHRRR